MWCIYQTCMVENNERSIRAVVFECVVSVNGYVGAGTDLVIGATYIEVGPCLL